MNPPAAPAAPAPPEPPAHMPLARLRLLRHLRFASRRLVRGGDRGATMLEAVLLLAAVALPSYFIIQTGLRVLFAHYRLVTTLNGLPFP